MDPNEFPLPFAVSGVKPKMGTEPPTTQTPATNFVKPRDSADTHHGERAPAATAASTPVRKKSDSSQMNNTAAKAEGDPKSSTSDASDPADTEPERKKSRKPIKIDPAILQRCPPAEEPGPLVGGTGTSLRNPCLAAASCCPLSPTRRWLRAGPSWTSRPPSS